MTDEDSVRFSIAFALDKDEFFRRTCPSCGRDFKTQADPADLSSILQPAFRRIETEIGEISFGGAVIDTRLVNSDQVFLLSADLENCLDVALSRLDTIPGGRINFDRESTRRLGSFDWDGRTLFLLNDSIRNDGFGDLYLYNNDTREIVQLNPIEGECCYRDARFSPDGKYVLFTYQRYDRSDIVLYYVPLVDMQNGRPFTPIELPSRFFSTAREKPQRALRPAE